MNNGKVRIYELSKELNLDNKELLDVCARLNIAVKSHSSTITETQAQRIRQAAKTVSAQAGTSTSVSAGNGSGTSRTPNRPKGKRKQQILALHKQQRSNAPSAEASTPVLAAPPRSPARAEPPSSAPVAQQADESVPQLKAPPQSPAPEPAVDSPAASPKSSERLEPSSPQLLRPPARPQESKPKLEPPSKQELETTASPSNERPVLLEPPKEQKEVSKEQPKLKKPKLKSTEEAKSEEEATPTTEAGAVDDSVEEEVLLKPPTRPKQKLKRPTEPNSSSWEEEDEKETEKAGKAGKSGTKTKRRPVVIDDDDELESLSDSKATPAVVSLSVARPPKPKNLTAPVSAQVTTKKKQAPSRPDSASAKPKERRSRKEESQQRPEEIVLSGNQTVRELSELLNTSETELITKLFLRGIAVNITQTLDTDTARLVAEEFGVQVKTAQKKSAAAKDTDMLAVEDLENLQRRPPVVTIMGHVDHGKTTLLDSIRKTKVAQGEAGGITQHIGAYHVDVEHNGKTEQVVFLDTPGHEAFTAMRARGTRVTDIAILVVAADDGVQPQTREAISHARAAEVPIVVAVNKIDKPGAEPDRVKQELTELSLVPEEWGGDTITVPVSALRGDNLDTLLEMILLVAEIEELSANPNRSAKGTVVEANLDRARGPVATLLVQNGTLRVGDTIVAGSVLGRIRAMIDDRGERVEAATPSFAVEVLGLNDVPAAGDEFDVYESEKEARAVADTRANTQRQTRLQQALSSRRVSLSSLSAQAQEGELKELNLLLKADVQGSVEAILGSLNQLPQDEVQIRVLLAAPGEVTETDVDLAAASGAVIVGFNTTLASGARQAADQQGVDIREYNVIYKLLDEIQGAMEGLLDPEEVEEPLGSAEVRAVFPVGRGAVAGCYVQSGKIVRNRLLRVRRGDQVVYEGPIDSLKRMKDDVREVNAGYECGINSTKFNDWQEGDIIEAYEMVMKRRTLST
ncbi:MAG: translation initiation factor IF-2 [Cyanophyceae cyanobacterium]